LPSKLDCDNAIIPWNATISAPDEPTPYAIAAAIASLPLLRYDVTSIAAGLPEWWRWNSSSIKNLTSVISATLPTPPLRVEACTDCKLASSDAMISMSLQR
jgi:hypothetical protein